MDISAKKIELIAWLTQLQDKAVLQDIESLKNKSSSKSYESSLRPMSNNEYKTVLEKAEDDYKKGKVTSQKDIEKQSQNW